MKLILGLILSVSLFAQTKMPTTQIKAAASPSTLGLLMVLTNGQVQTVTLGAGLSIVMVPGAIFPEIRAVAPSAITTNYVNIKTRQLSDGTWVPTAAISGKVVLSSIMIFRNGLLQDDSDFSFDSSNNSIKLIVPLDPTDKLSFSCQTVQ